MPTHPPRSEATKKVDILARRETALRRAILDRHNDEQLHCAAEAVRVAQLNLIKAKLASVQYGKKGLATRIVPGAKIERQMKQWCEITSNEIVAMYEENKLHEANHAP